MTARLLLPTQAVTAKGDLPSRELVEIIQRLVAAAGSGGGGLADGDYGDITISGGGTVMTIDAGAIALDDLSDVVITAPATNEILAYDGTKWVNVAATAGGSPIIGWVI